MDPQMIEGMRRLCGKAGIITPNLTEAAFLLGKNDCRNITLKEAVGWCRQLSENGPGYVIITSAPLNP